MRRTEHGIDITAADCGPGLLRLIFSRSERWFWRHRACSVEKYSYPRDHYDLWSCETHRKTWIDYWGMP